MDLKILLLCILISPRTSHQKIYTATYPDDNNTTSLEITCNNVKTFDLDEIPERNFPNISNFRMSYCPFPSDGFPEIFNKLNTTSVESIFISGPTNQIIWDRSKLQNLTSIQVFILTDAEHTELTDGMFENNLQLTHVTIKQCNLSNVPSIFKNLSNLISVDLSSNDLETLPGDLFENLNYLHSLELFDNKINAVDSTIFKDLESLLILDLSQNNFTSLPDLHWLRSVMIIDLSKNFLKELPENLFQNNTQLHTLDLSYNTIENVPDRLFANNKNLTVLIMDYNRLMTVPLIKHLGELERLSLSNNQVEELPEDTFSQSYKLNYIDLSYNKLTKIAGSTFNKCTNVTNLGLAGNALTSITFAMLKGLQNLVHLDLKDNLVVTIDEYAFMTNAGLKTIGLSGNALKQINGRVFGFCPDVQRISLDRNYLEVFPKLMDFESLTELDLSFNRISVFEAESVIDIVGNQITIDLTYNKIARVKFLDKDLSDTLTFYPDDVENSIKVLLGFNPISCDCNIYELISHKYKSMAGGVYSRITFDAENLICANPEDLKNIPLQNFYPFHFNCKAAHCPDACDCFTTPESSKLTVDCSYRNLKKAPVLNITDEGYDYIEVWLQGNNLTEGPRRDMGYENVNKLLLHRNRIVDINWLPHEKIEVLLLHDNKISVIYPHVLKTLENATMLNITLHNNPLVCNCSTLAVNRFLWKEFEKVGEFTSCIHSNRRLTRQNFDIICSNYIFHYMIFTLAALLMFFLLSILIYSFCRSYIKLLCHKFCDYIPEGSCRDCHLHDIFISFSQKDEDFVAKELLPKLEAEPRPYKVCVHFRDWAPGEYISKHIIESISTSKRTIVVLSKHFMESVWGKWEFKQAHLKAMANQKQTLILILLSDFDDFENLDEELKMYINTKSYIKTDDPDFWEKLYKCLPRK